MTIINIMPPIGSDLINMGAHIFSCMNNKAPATPHGFHDAVCDIAAAHELWRQYPGELIGVATGELSNLDVLDVDVQHGGDAWLSNNQHKLTRTRIHRTRSGGWHLLFKHAPGLRNTAGKIAKGVDTRGDGGFIIWWPAAGLPVLSDAPPAPWPQWLLDKLLTPPAPPSAAPSTLHHPSLGGLIRAVAGASEGQRNSTIFWAACRAGEMIVAGLIGKSEVVEILVESAARCGLPRDEAHRTVLSGLKKTGAANA